jgi:hypothetical protein
MKRIVQIVDSQSAARLFDPAVPDLPAMLGPERHLASGSDIELTV